MAEQACLNITCRHVDYFNILKDKRKVITKKMPQESTYAPLLLQNGKTLQSNSIIRDFPKKSGTGAAEFGEMAFQPSK